MNIERNVAREMLVEALNSAWIFEFLRNHHATRKLTPAQFLPAAREALFRYFDVVYAHLYDDRTKAEVDAAFREVATQAVIVKPRDGYGVYKLTPEWNISEHGDTFDGEYEQVAPEWKRALTP